MGTCSCTAYNREGKPLWLDKGLSCFKKGRHVGSQNIIKNKQTNNDSENLKKKKKRREDIKTGYVHRI